MAVTYSATLMGIYRSAVRNVLVSCKVAESEVVTLVHMLGACPHEVRCQLRSGVTAPSGVFLSPSIGTLNASQAVVNFGAPNAGAGYFDIICEFTHSIVQ